MHVLDKPIDIEEVNLREEYDTAENDQLFMEVANRNFDNRWHNISFRNTASGNLFKEGAVNEFHDHLLFKESRRESDSGEFNSYETLLEILTNL